MSLSPSGVHVFQAMGGCEWNNETNETSAYLQLGFDGEDILSLDLKTETWVALNPQAVIIKHIWDMRGGAAFTKNLVSHMCLEYLKELVRYEKRTLKKKKGKCQLFQDFFSFFGTNKFTKRPDS